MIPSPFPLLLWAAALAAIPAASATQVNFTSAAATYDQGTPYVIGSTIDGITTGTTGGWGIYGLRFSTQAAFWKPSAALNGTNLEVRLIQNFGSQHWINEFRLSYTTDAAPSLAGTWSAWLPGTRLSTGTALTVVNTDHIRSEGAAAAVTYTLRGAFPVQGITGLRVDVYPFDFNAADGMAATIGRAANGNFVLSEFQAETDPEFNIALNKPVSASAALYGGFPVTNVVDGTTATFTHPLTDAGTLGFTYEVDLGANWSLTRIAIKNRADGCCPERLTNYQVQLYSEDEGGLGDLNWSSTIRGDNSNSGNAGTDTILAAADATPGHSFTGRYIRVINLSNAAYNPQISEIEAYGSLLPTIVSFTPGDDTISSGQSTTLAWQTANANSVSITPAPGSVAVTGNVSVSPAATTTYTLTAINASGSTIRTLNIGVDVTLLPPDLSEFQAAGSTVSDEDNTTQDWIELRNPNPYWLEVEGYRLTDDAANPALWTFPAGARIAPGGQIIVFASSKNRTNPAGNLHTNFNLDADGDYLALLSPAGVIIREFSPAYPPQPSGVSYGFAPGGGAAGFFKPGTPGTPNGTAYAGLVGDTSFSADRGFYDGPVDVAITCATADVEIRYTLDGTAPTATTGAVYAAPLHITGTTTLRAAAFRAAWAPSNVDTHTYIFTAQVIQQPAAPAGFPATWAGTPADYEMDPDVTTNPAYAAEMQTAMKSIRTLSLVLPPGDLFGATNGIYTFPESRGIAWERACSAELILPPGWVEQNGGVPPPPAGPNGGTGFQENCGLRIWGYGWRAHSATKKHALRLKFKAIYNGPNKLSHPLFPGWDVQKFDNIILRSQGSRGWNDFRTPDISQSQYIHDSFARDTAAEMGKLDGPATMVHLYLNGLYWGLYNAVLRPDASFGEEHYGGTEGDYDALNARVGAVEVINGDRLAWDAAKALGNAGLADNTRYQQLQQYVDLDNLIDCALYNCWATNHDGPSNQNNFRALRKREPNGQFRFYFWDMEYTFWSQTENAIASWVTSGDTVWSLFAQLRQNPEFRLRFADHVQRHCFNNGALTPGRAITRWNARATEIFSAILGESARWGDARRAIPFTRNVEWEAERTRLTGTYFPNRNANMIPHLQAQSLFPAVAAPVLNQHGGSVAVDFPLTLTGPGGATIFYTTTGTDPREAITGNAVGSPYGAAILLQTPGHTIVKARSRSGNIWSALTEAEFIIALTPASSANLAIAELHYHPAAGGAEFMEFLNISAGTIDLSGCSFTQGITYTFPTPTQLAAGQRLLLNEGSYSGGLSDGGERLTLMAPNGTTVIRSFIWDDEFPWPSADGTGPSLVLIAPFTNPDHSLPQNWRASMTAGGNPGVTDALAFTGDPLADPDNNGWSNLLEYALGPNPRITHVLTPAGLTMTIPRIPNADDARITGEVSTTLTGWTAADLIASTPGTLTYRIPVALASENHVFIRARVQIR